MSEQKIFEQLELIEHKIGHLLEKCAILEKERNELREQNADLEHRLTIMSDAEQQHVKEKEIIKEKVERLLEKIEGIGDQSYI